MAEKEQGANANTEGSEEATPDKQEQTQDEQTLTRADVEKLVQSETDRVRREYSTKLKEIESERDKLRERTETDAERHERELRELDTARKELRATQLAIAKRDIMEELGIPKKFERRIYGETAEEIAQDAKEFWQIYKDDYKADVEKGVNQALSSGPEPKQGDSPKRTVDPQNRKDGESMTEEQFVQWAAEKM